MELHRKQCSTLTCKTPAFHHVHVMLGAAPLLYLLLPVVLVAALQAQAVDGGVAGLPEAHGEAVPLPDLADVRKEGVEREGVAPRRGEPHRGVQRQARAVPPRRAGAVGRIAADEPRKA